MASLLKQIVRGTLAGIVLATLLAFPILSMRTSAPVETKPMAVSNLEEAIDATVFLLCKENKTGKPIASATGARLYSPKDGKWLIATAAHFTEGCRHTEKTILTIGPSEDGEEGFSFSLKRIVLEGQPYLVYKDKEHKLVTRVENRFEDVSLAFTEKKIKGVYSYFELRKELAYFKQPVTAIGFPGPYNNPPQVIVSMGNIQNPLVMRKYDEGTFAFIVHDALVWFGNSGGPLIDDNFKLMGLNVAIEGESRQRFYTNPVSYIANHLKELKYHQEIYGDNTK